VLAAVSGAFAFFIFRRSRFAVVAMAVLVVLLQLYTGAHSPSGSLVSIVVVAFLLRGARRMFQDHAEQKLAVEKA